MVKFGIYVHIPFCVKKCKYCDFISYTNCQNLVDNYINALLMEIKENAKYGQDKAVDTIYIGGGTPSCIDAKWIATILSTIMENYLVLPTCEISIECNPNSLTEEKIQIYKTAGVNRISIGLQAKQNSILKKIGRVHTLQQYIDAVKLCQKYKILSINTDVMFGLPTQKKKHILSTLALATKYSKHISIYSLILEPDTPLYKEVMQGKTSLPKEDQVVEWYEKAVKYLQKKGYIQYEVSNFALKGYECLHNLHCWQYQDYLGFGVSASSKMNGVRFTRTKNLEEYITLVHHQESTIIQKEVLTKVDQLEEKIMLGLRTANGIDLQDIKESFGYDLVKEKNEVIKELVQKNFMILENGFLKISSKGWYVMNTIIVDLLPN